MHCSERSHLTRVGTPPPAMRRDLAIGIYDLYARGAIVSTRRPGSAGRGTNRNRTARRPPGYPGIAHRRERPADPCLGFGKHAIPDAVVAEQPDRERGKGN